MTCVEFFFPDFKISRLGLKSPGFLNKNIHSPWFCKSYVHGSECVISEIYSRRSYLLSDGNFSKFLLTNTGFTEQIEKVCISQFIKLCVYTKNPYL